MAGSDRVELRLALAALAVAALALLLQIGLPKLHASGIAVVAWSLLVLAYVLHRVWRWLSRGRLQPLHPIGRR